MKDVACSSFRALRGVVWATTSAKLNNDVAYTVIFLVHRDFSGNSILHNKLFSSAVTFDTLFLVFLDYRINSIFSSRRAHLSSRVHRTDIARDTLRTEAAAAAAARSDVSRRFRRRRRRDRCAPSKKLRQVVNKSSIHCDAMFDCFMNIIFSVSRG